MHNVPTIISLTALVYVAVALVLAVVMLICWIWPRDADGSFMSPDDVEKILRGGRRSNLAADHEHGGDDMAGATRAMLFVLLALVSIGMILTRHATGEADCVGDDL